jgi:hypothetical protein
LAKNKGPGDRTPDAESKITCMENSTISIFYQTINILVVTSFMLIQYNSRMKLLTYHVPLY